jgi:hypothetical protein
MGAIAYLKAKRAVNLWISAFAWARAVMTLNDTVKLHQRKAEVCCSMKLGVKGGRRNCQLIADR